MNKKYCEPKCNTNHFSKAKSKHLGLVYACPKCQRLHTCRYTSISSDYPLRSMYYYWKPLDGEQ